MKKRSCRMTNEERAVHDFAVKVRKMTDKQLYDFVKAQGRTTDRVDEFIELLENQPISGVGPVTVKKIKEFAIKEGFIVGS